MSERPGQSPAEAADGAILSARNVDRVFRVGESEVHALQGVSLDIQAGELVSITGASGAGKSTLLHTLGGLERPTGGQVLLKGRDVYRMGAGERCRVRATEFGFVFQSYHLLPELDVLENVLIPGMTPAVRKLGGGGDVRARALELLERVGLGARAAHRPTELSGGEQQRVALARALVNRPGIILADEPTGNLDSATGQQVLDYLFALTREQGHTLVLVTHNEAVAALCDRTLHLHDGRLAR